LEETYVQDRLKKVRESRITNIEEKETTKYNKPVVAQLAPVAAENRYFGHKSGYPDSVQEFRRGQSSVSDLTGTFTLEIAPKFG